MTKKPVLGVCFFFLHSTFLPILNGAVMTKARFVQHRIFHAAFVYFFVVFLSVACFALSRLQSAEDLY